MISLVMPWRRWLSPLPSASSVVPDCPCTSMKPGATDQARGVDHAARLRCRQIADRGDAIAGHADVGARGGAPVPSTTCRRARSDRSAGAGVRTPASQAQASRNTKGESAGSVIMAQL